MEMSISCLKNVDRFIVYTRLHALLWMCGRKVRIIKLNPSSRKCNYLLHVCRYLSPFCRPSYVVFEIDCFFWSACVNKSAVLLFRVAFIFTISFYKWESIHLVLSYIKFYCISIFTRTHTYLRTQAGLAHPRHFLTVTPKWIFTRALLF